MEGKLFSVDIAGWFAEVVKTFFAPFWNFLVGFLPLGDEGIFEVIDSIQQVGATTTFNVFYLVNFSSVMDCAAVLVTVVIIVNTIKFVIWAVDLIHKAIEAVPFAE